MRCIHCLLALIVILVAGCTGGAIGRTPAEVQAYIPYAKESAHSVSDAPMRDGSVVHYDVRFYRDRVYDYNHETRQWSPSDVVYVAEFSDGRCVTFKEQSVERTAITVRASP
jgi:hypothetical protein